MLFKPLLMLPSLRVQVAVRSLFVTAAGEGAPALQDERRPASTVGRDRILGHPRSSAFLVLDGILNVADCLRHSALGDGGQNIE